MKNTFLPFLAVSVCILSLNSCNSSSSESASKSKHSNKDWTAAELEGHYSYEQNGDTIILDLNNQNDSLIGELSYNFEEKDRNNGVFRAVIKDSLIVGYYNFNSEGINSTRETVFGILPDGLIEGFGEIEEQDSLIVFKNKDSLRFDHGMVLEKR